MRPSGARGESGGKFKNGILTDFTAAPYCSAKTAGYSILRKRPLFFSRVSQESLWTFALSKKEKTLFFLERNDFYYSGIGIFTIDKRKRVDFKAETRYDWICQSDAAESLILSETPFASSIISFFALLKRRTVFVRGLCNLFST